MTNTVKRYSYGFHADGFGEGRTLGLIEKEDGNLVPYEDYELLREQRDSFQRVSILAMEERDRDAAARDQYRALSIKYGDKLSETLKERDALRAELAAIKGQEPVAFYWQDIGYPEPRTHGPYFGQPSESASGTTSAAPCSPASKG